MMSNIFLQNLGDIIYSDIDNNEYLLKLYEKLLLLYGNRFFENESVSLNEKEINDLLCFSDILSKSNHPEKNGMHKTWALEIISLLGQVGLSSELFDIYRKSVYINCTNIYMYDKVDSNGIDFLDDISNQVIKKNLEVPFHETDHFFLDQKVIFDNFSLGSFSYSAPTSMGKTFMMRIFIRHKIESGANNNFVMLVPTKALIQEIRQDITGELKGLLTSKNYRVVTNVGDIVLKQNHNFINIMTPERLLHLLNENPNFKIDYLFIDEAHKICSADTRSTFYYQIAEKLSKRLQKPTIFFSSPNIPNPELYKKMLPNQSMKQMATKFSPVSQIRFIASLNSSVVRIFNAHKKSNKFLTVHSDFTLNLSDFIKSVSKEKQTLVYCSSLADAIKYAREFSENLSELNDDELNTISKDIAEKINDDYYLVELIKKGVAYHVGYLPATIRSRIEKAFRESKIKIIFSTSTLIEGVNLPADNLVITSYKTGIKNLDEVGFKNLMGRAGRYKFGAFGNVFIYSMKDREKEEHFETLIESEVPDQRLSIDTALSKKQKQAVVDSLSNGDITLSQRPDTTTSDAFDFMRKISMILVENIVDKNHDTIVASSFDKELTEENVQKIHEAFKNEPRPPESDLTYDQYKLLKKAIEDGLKYPNLIIKDGKETIDFNSTKPFMRQLGDIFRWDLYEKDFLGKYSLLGWISSLLNQWMSGYGLGYIVRFSVNYKRDNPTDGIYNSRHFKIIEYFDYRDKEHRNLVYAEILSLLENTILFSVSNYFKAFSTEYKRFHGIEGDMDNDWYEYVEYGSMSSQSISLQKIGYSRDSANFILNQKSKFIDTNTPNNTIKFSLKYDALMNCTDEGVKLDTQDIFENIKEVFI